MLLRTRSLPSPCALPPDGANVAVRCAHRVVDGDAHIPRALVPPIGLAHPNARLARGTRVRSQSASPA